MMPVTDRGYEASESEWGTPKEDPIAACERAKRRGVRAPPEAPPSPPTLTPESEAESEAVFAKMRYTAGEVIRCFRRPRMPRTLLQKVEDARTEFMLYESNSTNKDRNQ
uniref:Enkurin domain-containing protein n=1 Tax=Panagrellus redivivus TaxID=6233 RepID=A0A7E4VIG8_PANRE